MNVPVPIPIEAVIWSKLNHENVVDPELDDDDDVGRDDANVRGLVCSLSSLQTSAGAHPPVIPALTEVIEGFVQFNSKLMKRMGMMLHALVHAGRCSCNSIGAQLRLARCKPKAKW